MRYASSVRWILVLLFPFITTVFTQEESTGKGMQNPPSSSIQGALTRYGITPKMLQNLKNGGIDLEADLPAMRQGKVKAIERTMVLMCDAAIIGKVTAIIGVPAPEKSPFHSKALIRVEQVFKGKLSVSDEINVLREWGPLSDSPGETLRVSPEQPLEVGEEAIFFLERPEKNAYLRSYFRRYFEKSNIEFPANTFWLAPYHSKMKILNGEILFNGEHRLLKEAIDNMQGSLKLIKAN